MRSVAAFLGSLLLTVAAAAQQTSNADLEIKIESNFSSPPRVQINSSVVHWFTITNLGPDTAQNVSLTVTAPQAQFITIDFPGCFNGQCNVGTLARNEKRTFRVIESYQPVPVKASTTARVTTSSNDPNPDNNTATAATDIVSLPDLAGFVNFLPTAEPEQTVTATMNINNGGTAPAHDVVLETQFPAGSTISAVRPAAGWDCTTVLTTVTCRAPLLAAGVPPTIMSVDFVTPPLYQGGSVSIATRASSADEDFHPENNSSSITLALYKFFAVRSTDDAGPDTLRQAILDANALCTPNVTNACRIGFRIPGPVPDPGWFTIQPLSPLPAIRTSVSIFGPGNASQKGQRPRPQLFLDGSRAGTGNGLDIRSGSGTIGQLAIGNFPGNGISVTNGVHAIQDSFIGTDPTGNVAAPNLRGIEGTGNQQLTIRHNVISGNRRTGVILSNISRPQLVENAIGLAADGESPLPNGASGVYLAEGCDWAFLWINDLAYNQDFGVAMHPSVFRALISLNAIYGNGQLGIDYGVDGATPNSDDDSQRMPNFPIVTAARYDAASGRTVISGTNESRAADNRGNRFKLELYASPAGEPPQAKTFLGSFFVGSKAPFQVNVKGDYRGQFVTGIIIRYREANAFDPFITTEETSEIGPAARVE